MIHIDKITDLVSHEFGLIRMISYEGKDWYAATDITKALGYKNNCKTIRRHCDNGSLMKAKINGRGQTMLFIEEKNLYRLVIKSKSKRAKAFEEWIFNS